MKKIVFILTCFVIQSLINKSVAQSSFGSESEVLKEAHNLYVSSEYADAMPLYAQLLSNHPNDPSYNYYYGVCILLSAKSKADAIKHLEAATSFKEAPSLLYFYLARAYHLDYQFQKAADQYQFFKSNSNPYYAKELHVDNLTEMCKTALGSGFDFEKSKELIVAHTEADENTFMNAYVFTKNNGKFLLMPDKFTKGKLSKDKFSRYVFLSASGKLLVFTGAGSGHKTDIFISKRKSSKDWGDPQPIIFDTDGDNDKMNPTIFENGDDITIYFSSNRNSSIGGFDVFKSTGNLKTNKWSSPENAGVPVNSPEDDFYYVPSISEGIGYVSTKRNCNAQTLNVLKIKVVNEPVKNILSAQIPVAKNELVLKADSVKPEIKISKQPSEPVDVKQAVLVTENKREAEPPKERIKTDEVTTQISSSSFSEKQQVTNAKKIDFVKQEVKVEEKEVIEPVAKAEIIKTEKPVEKIEQPLTIKTKTENKILPRPTGEPDLSKLNRDYDTGLPSSTVAPKPVEIKLKPDQGEQPLAVANEAKKTALTASKEPDLSKLNRDYDTGLPKQNVAPKAVDIKSKPVEVEQPLAVIDKPEKMTLSVSSKQPDISKLNRDYDTGLPKAITIVNHAEIKPKQVELNNQPVAVKTIEEKIVLSKSSGEPDLSRLNHDYDTGIPKVERQKEFTVKPVQVISQPVPTNNADKTVLTLSVKETKVEKVNQKNETQVLKTFSDKKQIETNNVEIKVKGIFYCVDDPKSMNAKLIITEATNESTVYSAKTNSTTGEYEFALPVSGKYKFIIDKEGYSLLEQIVDIADGISSVNQQLFLSKNKDGREQFRIINGIKNTAPIVTYENAPSKIKETKLIYKIQIGAYSAKPTAEILQKYKDSGISRVSYVTRENGTRIFYTGSTTDLSDAMSARQAAIEKNVPDAFIVVFSGERQITMEEALLTER